MSAKLLSLKTTPIRVLEIVEIGLFTFKEICLTVLPDLLRLTIKAFSFGVNLLFLNNYIISERNE